MQKVSGVEGTEFALLGEEVFVGKFFEKAMLSLTESERLEVISSLEKLYDEEYEISDKIISGIGGSWPALEKPGISSHIEDTFYAMVDVFKYLEGKLKEKEVSQVARKVLKRQPRVKEGLIGNRGLKVEELIGGAYYEFRGKKRVLVDREGNILTKDLEVEISPIEVREGSFVMYNHGDDVISDMPCKDRIDSYEINMTEAYVKEHLDNLNSIGVFRGG